MYTIILELVIVVFALGSIFYLNNEMDKLKEELDMLKMELEYQNII